MRVVILPTENEASDFAAQFISDFINNAKELEIDGVAKDGTRQMSIIKIISQP